MKITSYWLKNTNNIKDLTIYLKKYKKICIQKAITAADIRNIDEIRFDVNGRVVYWVIKIDLEKKLLLSDLENGELLTTFKSIGNREMKISPILI